MYAWLFALVFQGLAILAMCCLASAILNFVPHKANPLQKMLNRITAPVLVLVAFITPTLVPKSLHIFIAAFWLLILRVGFYLGTSAFGLLPAVQI